MCANERVYEVEVKEVWGGRRGRRRWKGCGTSVPIRSPASRMEPTGLTAVKMPASGVVSVMYIFITSTSAKGTSFARCVPLFGVCLVCLGEMIAMWRMMRTMRCETM